MIYPLDSVICFLYNWALMFWKTLYVIKNHWTHDLIYLNCRRTNSWVASLWASCKIFTKTGEKASAFTNRWVDIVTNFPQGNNCYSFCLIKGCPEKNSALYQKNMFFLNDYNWGKKVKIASELGDLVSKLYIASQIISSLSWNLKFCEVRYCQLCK